MRLVDSPVVTRDAGPADPETCGAEDDFYCLRYAVWYPSIDCALRTKYRTAPGCLRCDQGRFNLKRHAAALARIRFRPLVVDDPEPEPER
ncbi:MAG TPA: hypothetical protein VJS92_02930 [Candidatus Polarisedimenticolaceae bacterium]|nr:hypothetical protein [Candidatus Polarisedimenticolaceae bacterium]